MALASEVQPAPRRHVSRNRKGEIESESYCLSRRCCQRVAQTSMEGDAYAKKRCYVAVALLAAVVGARRGHGPETLRIGPRLESKASIAVAVNARGELAGSYFDGQRWRGFLLDRRSGELLSIEPPPGFGQLQVAGLDAAGVLIGNAYANTLGLDAVPVRYSRARGIERLADLVTTKSAPTQAYAINDSGVILVDGDRGPCLLVPVQEQR